MTDHEVYIFDGDPRRVVSVTVNELQRLCRELYADGSDDRGLGLIDGEEMNESLSELVTVHERTCHMLECHEWQDEWEPYGIYCSECKEFVPDWNSKDNPPMPKYCPHCGARVVDVGW